MRFLRSGVLAAAALLSVQLVAPATLAQAPEIFQPPQGQQGTPLAIGGYDPVTYHSIRMPVPGNGQYRVRWKGAEWRFSSSKNRDLFVEDPVRYAPQYGGWCAFALAHGSKAPSDPLVFDVVGGRLFLNQDQRTQSLWKRDQPGFIQRADQQWPRIANQ